MTDQLRCNVPSIFVRAGQANGAGAAKKEAWYSQRRPTYEAQPETEPESPAATPSPAPHAKGANGKKNFQPLASVTERPRRADSPASPVAPVAFTGFAGPMPPANTLSIPLSEVLPDLPEEIRHALNAADAGVATFQIPRAEVESGMRTGRLSFKWAQLRDWCSLPLPLDAPVAPDMEITLPLSSVVPHFMATRGTPDTRKPVEIDSRIPDIFSKAKSAAPADEVTAVVPAPLPPEPTSPPPSASPPPSTPVTPTQIIAHIRSLNGISGAFIATSDGLLVAGDTPGANENVLAAFAPTVFSQLTKYADMARLGLPDSIDIHLSGVSVHVRRAGKLFLGALTLGGSPLPLQELARISAALQPHTN